MNELEFELDLVVSLLIKPLQVYILSFHLFKF